MSISLDVSPDPYSLSYSNTGHVGIPSMSQSSGNLLSVPCIVRTSTADNNSSGLHGSERSNSKPRTFCTTPEFSVQPG